MARMLTHPTAFFNPPIFQGAGKTRQYFEGWYFKLIDADGKHAFAVIPGVSMDPAGHKKAFIQLLDGKAATAVFHTFPFTDFKASSQKFEVHIGDNYFSDKEIFVQLPDWKADLSFTGQVPWPTPVWSPGIMGPFSFIPFMECYHGIVSMDHRISGRIIYENKEIDMDGGRGYMEKDWGRSFPAAYIWMQSNHFSTPGFSLKASVAKIPWIGSSFTGFIAGFWLQKQLIRFTTYNRSKVLRAAVGHQSVELELQHPSYLLQIKAQRERSTELASPILGDM
jgi:tocopherol cyclase